MESLHFKIEETEAYTYIKITGDIQGMVAFDLKDKLKEYVTKKKDLRIDLTNVTEINLTGLNSILISKAYANGHDIKITLVLEETSKILKHLHLTKLMDEFIIEIVD